MARKSLLNGFKISSSVKCEKILSEENYAKFTAETFEKGYGTTIGNTLRRILRSSIQGWAIAGLKVISYDKDKNPRYLSSEFEQIPGVVQDTLEFVANLKKVHFKFDDSEALERVISLSVKGPCELKLKDLETSSDIKAFSDVDVLLNITDEISLDIEFTVFVGRGYTPSEDNKKSIEDVTVIPIDSIFSPIKNVTYSVEKIREGEVSDYERLIIEIWTDGVISPEDALGEAAKLAKEQFTAFINFDESQFSNIEESSPNQIKEMLKLSIDELELTSRSKNCLDAIGIKTIGELILKTEDELSQTKNFGKKSLEEIKEKLKDYGLDIGIKNINSIKKVIKTSKDKK